MRFLFDEDEIFAGIGFHARHLGKQRTGTSMPQPFGRSSRTTPFFGTYVSDPRPTKAEALKELEFLSIPFRLIAPFAGPIGGPILSTAPKGAEILINLDPQDRFRD